jgi:hypothetical protein
MKYAVVVICLALTASASPLRLNWRAKGANKSSSNAAAKSNTKSGGNLQSSTTLDPSVIANGFEQNGQQVPTAGQVASLTSSNNFINFCATTKQPITNGQQVKGGSCNPAPMGSIPSTANMPSCKFSNPKNLDTIKANQNFTITMNIQGMTTGNFVNADSNYFAAPQQLDKSGKIIGHSHVVVEKLDSLKQTTPTDPTKFAFFKGLNDPAQNGELSAVVSGGLPAGTYKVSSINTAANHQPALVPVAQHGSLDDVVYFTVANDGKSAGGGATGGAKNTKAGGKGADKSATKSAAGSKSAGGNDNQNDGGKNKN